MKTTVTTLFIILVIAVIVTVKSQPEIPANDCKVNNQELATMCLSFIPKYYNADYLGYLGHTRAWVYRWSEKLGVSLGEKQSGYLANYSSFEDAVNCYLEAAGDISLNMTLPPTEFSARYEQIAGEYGLQN